MCKGEIKGISSADYSKSGGTEMLGTGPVRLLNERSLQNKVNAKQIATSTVQKKGEKINKK